MKWAVLPIYGFLLAAPLIVVFYSFSPSVVMSFPPDGVTLRWYARLWGEARLLNGIVTSVLVGALATVLALGAGIPAAYALTRSRRRLLSALFLSPLILPGIVIALGLLMTVSVLAPGMAGSIGPLLGAHVLVTLPWVIRTVSASLETTDPHLEEAARGLGASPVATFFLVTVPSIRSGIVTAAIFAFIVSFGNFALSLFFSSGRTTTLPVAIFEYIDQFQDPTVSAASSLVIFGTALLVILGTRLRKSEWP